MKQWQYLLRICFWAYAGPLSLHAQDTKPTPTQISVGSEFSFQINKLHQRHYFQFTSPGDGVINLELVEKLQQHKSIFPWWGEDAKSNEIRDGLWNIRAARGETITLAIRSSRHSFNEVAHEEIIRAKVIFTPEHSPTEPNDTADTAAPLNVGEEFTFQIHPIHERDYFRITSPGDGVLKLELTQKLEHHSSIFPWWGEDAKRNEIRDGLWDIRAAKGEIITLAIRSNRHSFNETSNNEVIRAKVTFTPEHSPSEPNDSAETATPLAVGEEFTLQLNPLHDRDYFRLTSPGDGILKLQLSQKLQQHKSIFPWWGEDAKRNEIRDGLWDIRATKGENVILAIRSNRHSFNEISNHEIIDATVSFTPEHSPSEPNDSADTAMPITIGEEFTFQLNPLHDCDYFRLASPRDGVLKLELTQKPQLHTTIFPWWGEDAKRNQIRDGQWDIRATKGEIITLAIRSNRHSFNETSNNEIIYARVIMMQDQDGEPNDTPEQATLRPLDQPFDVILMPKGDRDFLRFEAPDAGIIRLERLDSKPLHKGLHPIWLQGEITHEGAWDTRVQKGEKPILILRGSVHSFLEIASPEPITLRANFIPASGPADHGDDQKNATVVKINEPLTFSLEPSWDQDYFAFTPEADGYVSFSPDEKSSRFSIEHWWHDPQNPERIYGADLPVSAGQTYHLALTPRNNGWSSPETLTARITYLKDKPTPPTTVRRWSFPIQLEPASK